ncbi:MAG: Proteasome lid subunit RPN8/RPN11 containing Jab1/MPN domain [Candidatus Methanohalarchaeum thermophilum]|uniref:Proteasome lid subunit RPN8/RPN11 containing Jab1/MPN domain n=1 Tax=Methanohalarchaeum thermophilum TaxID=1903181 RepID=A0A1Q6DUS9_METT1|nr:MAG: Proteasome lid subunit RPN8/RPN11 containing Jab1/MPN domain [Candidatus Methanohalarchaeum thermophilum]
MNKNIEIEKGTLEFILEIGKSAYPKEMVGLLTTKDKVISDVILVPGTFTSEVNAIMRLDMLPVGMNVIGSVHSHPSGNTRPSEADKQMFSKNGKIHIITGSPFKWGDWSFYDKQAKEISLKVVEGDEDDTWSEEIKWLKENIEE